MNRNISAVPETGVGCPSFPFSSGTFKIGRHASSTHSSRSWPGTGANSSALICAVADPARMPNSTRQDAGGRK
jgi:hypothetical protein